MPPSPELIVEERDGLRIAALISERRIVDLAIDRLGGIRRYRSIWLVKPDRIVPHVGAFAALDAGSGLLREEGLASGETMIAQVKSVRAEGKADILTRDICLTGRHFVLLPRATTVALSRSADNADAVVAAMRATLATVNIRGGIIRRHGLLAGSDAVLREAIELAEQWHDIEARGRAASPGQLLVEGPDAVSRLQADYPMHRLKPLAITLEARGFDNLLTSLITPEIRLPGGGSVIIEETSALTAIDVNAGTRPPGDADAEGLAVIIQQIRLRNLSGLIVIDFAAASSKKAAAGGTRMLETVRRALADDPAAPRLVGLSPSGLVEITRAARDLPLALKVRSPP